MGEPNPAEPGLVIEGSSHVGLVHEVQEDSWTVMDTLDGGKLLLVCDGMGGMGKGDEASAIAVKTLTKVLKDGDPHPPARMREAIRIADATVRKRLCDQQQGMPGSTAVMAWIRSGWVHVAWVGDSRAYLIRDGQVVERTRDHKLVTDLVEAGQLTAEEARSSALAHVVTRALGGRTPADPAVRPESLPSAWALKKGDYVVLCSDGVCDLIDDDELPELLGSLRPEEAAKVVVEAALDRGGHDNTTIIVARWEGEDVGGEEAKETPMFAPSRDQSAEDETTDPGHSKDAVFDETTDESIYTVDTSAEVDEDASDERPGHVEHDTLNEAEPWKAALVIALSVVLGAVALWASGSV